MTKLRFIVPVLLVTAAAAVVVALGTLSSEGSVSVHVPGGDAEAGRRAIEAYGCTSCHAISGVVAPTGRAGPSLEDFASRRTIAGNHPNTLDVLIRWIQDPQSLEPGTLMPDLGVSEQEARDIAAYLYSSSR